MVYSKKALILLILISLGLTLSFSVVLADDTSGGAQDFSGGSSLQNPLGGITDPREIVGNVIRALLGVVGSLALGVFILGGFTWVTSAGSEEKIKKGKDMVMWAAFGLAMIFMSYALVTFVIGALVGGSGASTSTSPAPRAETPD